MTEKKTQKNSRESDIPDDDPRREYESPSLTHVDLSKSNDKGVTSATVLGQAGPGSNVTGGTFFGGRAFPRDPDSPEDPDSPPPSQNRRR